MAIHSKLHFLRFQNAATIIGINDIGSHMKINAIRVGKNRRNAMNVVAVPILPTNKVLVFIKNSLYFLI